MGKFRTWKGLQFFNQLPYQQSNEDEEEEHDDDDDDDDDDDVQVTIGEINTEAAGYRYSKGHCT